jgi:hypothetical protein
MAWAVNDVVWPLFVLAMVYGGILWAVHYLDWP